MPQLPCAALLTLLACLPACAGPWSIAGHAGASAAVGRGTPAAEKTAFPRVTRAEVMATAETYASHRWTGRAANIRHGWDRTGIRVDTPDISYRPPGAIPGYWVPDRESRGIPYQWGGFSTPKEFDAGVAAGMAAGDVYTAEKRRLLEAGVSKEAVGIDCSGFISRCWRLPRAYSTRRLAALCDPLPDWESLQPGDAVNLHNAHVLLFSGWVDPDHKIMAAYETGGPPDWKVVRHAIPLSLLQKKGYQPLRYRGIR